MIFKIIQISVAILAFSFIFTLMEENRELKVEWASNTVMTHKILKRQDALAENQVKLIRIITSPN